MSEITLVIISIGCLLTFVINYWKMDERVTRLEALVKCLESEIIALRRKITVDEDEEGDSE